VTDCTRSYAQQRIRCELVLRRVDPIGSSYSTLAKPRNNPDAMRPSIRSAGTILRNRIFVHARGRGAAQRNRRSSGRGRHQAGSRTSRRESNARTSRNYGANVALVNLPQRWADPHFHGVVKWLLMPNSPGRPSRRLGPQFLVKWICVFTLFRPILTQQLACRPAEHGSRTGRDSWQSGADRRRAKGGTL